MNAPHLLGETEFHQKVDALLQSLETALETAEASVDTEIVGGILSLEFDDGSKVIINRQTPLREVWVAAKSGGFHFRFDGHLWRDTRSQEPLATLLNRVLSTQSGSVIAITI